MVFGMMTGSRRVVPSVSFIVCAILILLSFASRTEGKRGGGDSSDSGGGGGGGGGGDSGSGGGDSGYTGPTTAQCNDARALQTRDTFLMPASYYIGNLTIVHKLTDNSAWHNLGHYCRNDDDQPKRYDYDAILAVGPVRDGNDTAEVFWSLQAYPRVQQFSSDPKNEFVRIRSSSYGVYESGNMSLRFDYPYVGYDDPRPIPWNESFRDYWISSLSPTGPGSSNTSAPVGSWDISATYVRRPDDVDPRHDHPLFPHNLVTLSDVCYSGYSNWYDDKPELSPFATVNSSYSSEVMAPVIFLDLGASVLISGVGTERATMHFPRQSLVQQLALVHHQTEGGCQYDRYGVWPWELLTTMETTTSDYSASDNNDGDKQLKLSFDIEMSFEGLRNETVSTAFAVARSTEQDGPQWGNANTRLARKSAVMLAIVVSVMMSCVLG
ncbi:hypothetical protein B0A48_10078 [Cryoendolithus antarcticus]|uniref:Peptidase A1 domain-containing protein n=1 Tax=Cryoendolithus antarcticus TaxID=1507870 RepID=A0A1V8SW62_9PEZI|nr:hypothetical protein B0A48_10078 [Cryoendolithus antarcticus]